MAYDRALAAMTVFMEASGESEEGQRAVAHVLVNRWRDGRWGKTLASVCLWPYQFSCWNTKDNPIPAKTNRIRMAITPDDEPVLKNIEQIVDMVLNGDPDNTDGALFYVNPRLADPVWDDKMTRTAQIGSHLFYKEKKTIPTP